jgi:Co/Zn/Cd efflux system component
MYVMVLKSRFVIVRQTSFILLQGVPSSVPLEDVNEALIKVKKKKKKV